MAGIPLCGPIPSSGSGPQTRLPGCERLPRLPVPHCPSARVQGQPLVAFNCRVEPHPQHQPTPAALRRPKATVRRCSTIDSLSLNRLLIPEGAQRLASHSWRSAGRALGAPLPHQTLANN